MPTEIGQIVEQVSAGFEMSVGGWRRLTGGWTTNLYVDPGFVVRGMRRHLAGPVDRDAGGPACGPYGRNSR